jgi:endonuclease/exonuclease/phosphatase family metal-dependent hydrolase
MRILNWNIEWMNDWFVGGNTVQFRQDNARRGITDVDDLCQRVAGVIQTLDPDVLTIQEGPSDIREMLLFTDNYLQDNQGQPQFDVFGGIDGGAQKIYILVKRNGDLANARVPQDQLTQGLADPWEADIDGDLTIEGYEFTRLPVVIQGELPNNSTVTIVSLHTKSKYVHNGEAQWRNLETRPQFIAAALKNRRRISTEAMRVRTYIDDILSLPNNADSQIVVTGDFNDGPGTDRFESRYLTHNITDILLGSTFRPELLFRHAFLSTVADDLRYTAIFDDFIDEIPNRPLVLDHIILSPVFAANINGDIAHAAYNAAVDSNAAGRQQHPSDHRPVLVDIP